MHTSFMKQLQRVRPFGQVRVRSNLRMVTATATGSTGKVVVAVDGPAASGKGTLSKSLASAFNLAHLDTGLLYRSIGMKAVQQGVALDDEDRLESLCLSLVADDLRDPALRSDDAATAASKVSVYPKVRVALLEFQRKFARCPPEQYNGAVLDGRDIGTNVCPDAPVKLFITADVEVRAERRWMELQRRGEPASMEDVLAAMRERDARDTSRAAAPLRPADDAVILDTSRLTAEQALEAAGEVVRKWSAGVGAGGVLVA